MNIISFEELLPSTTADSSTALEKIRGNMVFYNTAGFFASDQFVGLFRKKIRQIIENLPADKEVRMNMEKELAYIYYDLSRNHGLVLARDPEEANTKNIEVLVDEKGVSSQYLAFMTGKYHEMDRSNPDLFVNFLDYLSGYFPNGIEDVTSYIQACIRISQIDGGFDILMIHLFKKFSSIPYATTASMIEDHGYLGGGHSDIDIDINTMMRSENISREEAMHYFTEHQLTSARFHVFLGTLYNEHIYPKIGDFSNFERSKMHSMLNDFKDIIDPEGYVPVYFDNGNFIESVERNKASQDGREVH